MECNYIYKHNLPFLRVMDPPCVDIINNTEQKRTVFLPNSSTHNLHLSPLIKMSKLFPGAERDSHRICYVWKGKTLIIEGVWRRNYVCRSFWKECLVTHNKSDTVLSSSDWKISSVELFLLKHSGQNFSRFNVWMFDDCIYICPTYMQLLSMETTFLWIIKKTASPLGLH